MLGDCDNIIFLVNFKCPFIWCCYNDFFLTINNFNHWYAVFIECYGQFSCERLRVIPLDGNCLYALLRNRKLCSSTDIIKREIRIVRPCNYRVQVIIKRPGNGRLRGSKRKYDCISISRNFFGIWIEGKHAVCRHI